MARQSKTRPGGGDAARLAILVVLVLLACPARGQAIDIRVQGVPAEFREAVANSISMGPAPDDEAIGRDEALRRMHRGRQQVKKAMTSFGYYRARVSGELSGDAPAWQVSYRVTPGPRLRYREMVLEITGPASAEKPLLEYLSRRPLAEGDPVDHGRHETVKQELLKRTLALGYLDARLDTHRVVIDLESYHADARVVVTSGPRYRFGEIRLEQDVLDEEYVQGFITIRQGEPYSDQRLLKLEQDLRDSDYFSEIQVEPRFQEVDEAGHVPVQVRLSGREPSEYQAGLGFGTDTGIRGSLSWQQRRLNKQGHRLGSSLLLSELGGSAEAHYTIPFGDPRREQYKLFANYIEDKPDSNDSQLGQLGIRRSSALGRTRMDLSFTYQHEDFAVAGQSGLTDLFIPGIALSRVKADNRLFTRQGLRWQASLQGTPGLLSDFAFIQPRVSGKLIHGIGDARVILRGEAAWTAAKLDDLPASLRFFAGGDQSVRGFGYETLGPENQRGEVTGGRQLLIGSAEIDHPISNDWRLAAFIDAGNAFDDYQEPLRKSVGIGIRRMSPIGPIRVDLALPLSGGKDSVRLHVTLGPDL